MYNWCFVILCSDYLRTLSGAHSYYPTPVLLDCSVGGVYLRHWELSVIDGRILFCFATLGTRLSLLHLCYC